ncbi:thioredoxin family protein [Myxococcota bacterium]|nr:thioredoxin family protein [Myxococcota bacterium]
MPVRRSCARWSRRATITLAASLGVLAPLGCRMGPEAAVARTAPPAAPDSTARSAAPASTPAAAPATTAPASTAAPKPGSKQVELPANVDWQTWDAGLARAKAENKPALLLVWAHWCPRCRELAPVFGQPEIAALAKGVVMIQQDADERPAWLTEKFDADFGGYVPRVFLLRPDGTVRTDITSGNPQYPYFYVPRDAGALVRALEKALRG